MFLDAEIGLDEFEQGTQEEISLEDLQPNRPVLRGTVQVWLREASLLRSFRKRFEDDSHSVEMKYEPEPDRHLNRLTFFLKGPDRLDVSTPRRIEEERDSWQPLVLDSAVWAKRGTLRIALCPLPGPWRPQFDLLQEGKKWSFLALPELQEDEEDALCKHLQSVLEEVKRRKIHILVFPELSVDPRRRGFLRAALKTLRPNPLLAVFAGSFHISDDGDPVPYNQAIVWDGRGASLWEHLKRGRYRLSRGQLALPATRTFFPKMPETPVGPAWERIRKGNELVVVDTRLGRLALLVCADALEPEREHLDIIGRIRPDLVVIIAMSPKTAEFDRARARLVSQNIGVLLVNAACVCTVGQPDSDELALADLSFHESDDLPPTRWRWRVGRSPEWYRYRRSDRKSGSKENSSSAVDERSPWRPVEELRGDGEGVVSLLEGGAGLVLNLGAYLLEASQGRQGRHRSS